VFAGVWNVLLSLSRQLPAHHRTGRGGGQENSAPAVEHRSGLHRAGENGSGGYPGMGGTTTDAQGLSYYPSLDGALPLSFSLKARPAR